jgi:hypothetical protein
VAVKQARARLCRPLMRGAVVLALYNDDAQLVRSDRPYVIRPWLLDGAVLRCFYWFVCAKSPQHWCGLTARNNNLARCSPRV